MICFVSFKLKLGSCEGYFSEEGVLSRKARLSSLSYSQLLLFEGTAESVCGQDVNQSLSQPTKYIPLAVHKAPELTKLQAASCVGVRNTWPLELAHETELRWKSHLFC